MYLNSAIFYLLNGGFGAVGLLVPSHTPLQRRVSPKGPVTTCVVAKGAQVGVLVSLEGRVAYPMCYNRWLGFYVLRFPVFGASNPRKQSFCSPQRQPVVSNR